LEAQEILADYHHLGLTTGRHPLALLRPWLRRHRILSSEELRAARDGAAVVVGGLITHMQQPGTASGVTFVSLEDETGITNIIVWPQVFAEQRHEAMAASLLVVSGTLQHHDAVIRVVVGVCMTARWLHSMRAARAFR
jgi:error-prone DNA polymerase